MGDLLRSTISFREKESQLVSSRNELRAVEEKIKVFLDAKDRSRRIELCEARAAKLRNQLRRFESTTCREARQALGERRDLLIKRTLPILEHVEWREDPRNPHQLAWRQGNLRQSDDEVHWSNERETTEAEPNGKTISNLLAVANRRLVLRRYKMCHVLVSKIFNFRRLALYRDLGPGYELLPGLVLPSSIDHMRDQMLKNNKDDEYYSTGLGMLCQLLVYLAKYLRIHCRSKLIPLGSRSKIFDTTGGLQLSSGVISRHSHIYNLYCDKNASQANRKVNLDKALDRLRETIEQVVLEAGSRVFPHWSLEPSHPDDWLYALYELVERLA